MKIAGLIAKLILILCIPLLLLSSSLAWGFNSKWIYNYGFNKYDVSLQTGFSPVELDKASSGLIHYLNSNEDYPDIILLRDGKSIELFTRDEKLHFKDVKQLVRLDYLFLIISFIVFLLHFIFGFYWKKGINRKQLAKNIVWGCSISILIIFITGIASIFYFDQLFLQFHYLVFSNQYWSAPGYMLQLFPGGFWVDAALICGVFMIALALLQGGASFAYIKTEENKK